MNTDDTNLAYKVRHALNEQLDTLPDATTSRLASARAAALARKKADAPHRAPAQQQRGFSFGSLVSGAGLGRIAVAIPLFALVAGLAGVYQHEQQQHISDMAELDAAVLSDELPLTAYLDDGFNAYLASQQRTR
jgi:uncharacterized protein HemX